MTYSRIVRGDAREYDIYSLTIKKEMIFPEGLDQHEKYTNLCKLQEEKFTHIKIPKFRCWIDGDLLVYESDFIKGKPIRSIKDFNNLYEDIIERDSDYSFINMLPENYIKDPKGNIYAIDLDEYGYHPYEERKEKWEKFYGWYAPIIEKYRGTYQLNVQIYGNDQRQKKIKDLVEGTFNANITMHDGEYLVIIDDKKLHTFVDTLDYLKELYSEIRMQMDINVNGAIRSIKKSSELFDRNNRTLSIG